LGDSLTVLKENGEELKIYLSSIRPPRREGNEGSSGARFRPLYDVPFMFDAREILRKRVIGKKVQVNVDYIQAKTDQFPEKTCCTVQHNGQNLAELLLEKGLVSFVEPAFGN
jgi:staphylococcal nuclease domain-containing protein 1